MASINITSNEFADLAVLFLLDKVANPDEVVPNNEMFNEFIEKVGTKIKPQLVQYFLNLDAYSRVMYKRIQPPLLKDGNKSTYTIAIQNKAEKKES
jgi:hypothetical protein